MSIISLSGAPPAGTQIGDKTLYASQFPGLTNEARITAAIARAVAIGALYVYIPANMLPYNPALVTFNNSVMMIREGGPTDTYDVHAYGAAGDAVTDDSLAINTAILAANVGLPGTNAGQFVDFYSRKYIIKSPVVIPAGAGVTTGSVILRGKGQRPTYIYPSGTSATFAKGSVRFGTDTPDASGSFTNILYYCGMENISVNGSLITGTNAIGVAMVETQRCRIRNSIIEQFSTVGSIALQLLGSTTSGGIGAAAAPHCWRCEFDNLTIATSYRPVVWQNADENDFYSLTSGVPTGLGAIAADSVINLEFVQGRNNRLYGLLCDGDDSNLTPNVAIQFDNPVNGDVLNNQVYGVVAEGFDIVVNVLGVAATANQVRGLNSSISNTIYNNVGYPAGATDPHNGTVIEAPLHNLYYMSATSITKEGHAIALAAGAQTLDVTKYDVFYISGNAGGSSITSFTTTVPGVLSLEGREIWLKFSDNNTTIVDASQVGGNNIRLQARQNQLGLTDSWICLKCNGQTWYQVTAIIPNTATAAFSIPTGTIRPVVNKTAAYTAVFTDHYILCDPSAGSFVVTIPTATGNRGLEYIIKHKSASANSVTITPAGGNIDNAASKVLSSLQSARVVSDGTNWYIA